MASDRFRLSPSFPPRRFHHPACMTMSRLPHIRLRWLGGLVLLVMIGCATPGPSAPQRTPQQIREQITGMLPASLPDRAGWAADIQSAFAALQIEPTTSRLCAVIAVTQQESGMTSDPEVPGLPRIVRTEIERRAGERHIPAFVVGAALKLRSPDGRTYEQRLQAVRTERDVSRLFDEFIAGVPLGKRLFADDNPVQTGGPMQVSIAWSQRHARQRTYPYPAAGSIRDEVFSRRGGMYFGIAHLLDYPVSYDRMLYRFADFNAGHYASRNAAFQSVVARLTATKLALDGDLVAPGGSDQPGATEQAVRKLGGRLNLGDAAIRRDLERENEADFDRTAVYRAVYALAEGAAAARPAPRAVLPQIRLVGPKISRNLTTAWFAERVDGRRQQCVARVDGGGNKGQGSGPAGGATTNRR